MIRKISPCRTVSSPRVTLKTSLSARAGCANSKRQKSPSACSFTLGFLLHFANRASPGKADGDHLADGEHITIFHNSAVGNPLHQTVAALQDCQRTHATQSLGHLRHAFTGAFKP